MFLNVRMLRNMGTKEKLPDLSADPSVPKSSIGIDTYQSTRDGCFNHLYFVCKTTMYVFLRKYLSSSTYTFYFKNVLSYFELFFFNINCFHCFPTNNTVKMVTSYHMGSSSFALDFSQGLPVLTGQCLNSHDCASEVPPAHVA